LASENGGHPDIPVSIGVSNFHTNPFGNTDQHTKLQGQSHNHCPLFEESYALLDIAVFGYETLVGFGYSVQTGDPWVFSSSHFKQGCINWIVRNTDHHQ
jgi:hypothetical protein